jgi:hypothetical protein
MDYVILKYNFIFSISILITGIGFLIYAFLFSGINFDFLNSVFVISSTASTVGLLIAIIQLYVNRISIEEVKEELFSNINRSEILSSISYINRINYCIAKNDYQNSIYYLDDLLRLLKQFENFFDLGETTVEFIKILPNFQNRLLNIKKGKSEIETTKEELLIYLEKVKSEILELENKLKYKL